MWFTPRSIARRSTVIARSRPLGVPSAFAVRRIAPNPIRLTVRSPSFQVPAADALVVVTALLVFEVMAEVCLFAASPGSPGVDASVFAEEHPGRGEVAGSDLAGDAGAAFVGGVVPGGIVQVGGAESG